jgi:Xaa-Pro dipeptidase
VRNTGAPGKLKRKTGCKKKGRMKMDMTRIEKVIEDMRKMNLEQFLVTDPMAVYYLTGQYYACGERMMVLRLDVEKEPVLVIGKLFPQDEEKLGIKVVYFDDTDDCVEVLASHMRKGGTIGIDKTWPARFLLRLMELQVGDAYSNASTIIDHIRQIKTEEEQQKMRVASRCNDTSIEELIPLVSNRSGAGRRTPENLSEKRCSGTFL